MHQPGQELRRTRERLRLKYRDVEEATARIAVQRANDQFTVGLSRLADIENKGTIPSIYRLYSLCAVYRLNFRTVLAWYGVSIDELPKDAALVGLNTTNLISLDSSEQIPVPPIICQRSNADFSQTFYINTHLQRWGKLPASLLRALDLTNQKYAFIGLQDWFMYPLLRPGSFIQIDETKKKVATGGWTSEWDRPIYLFEHRAGFRCGWGSLRKGDVVIQPHPVSQASPEVYKCPGEIEIIGQVVGVAMRLDRAKPRHTHFGADPE